MVKNVDFIPECHANAIKDTIAANKLLRSDCITLYIICTDGSLRKKIKIKFKNLKNCFWSARYNRYRLKGAIKIKRGGAARSSMQI